MENTYNISIYEGSAFFSLSHFAHHNDEARVNLVQNSQVHRHAQGLIQSHVEIAQSKTVVAEIVVH